MVCERSPYGNHRLDLVIATTTNVLPMEPHGRGPLCGASRGGVRLVTVRLTPDMSLPPSLLAECIHRIDRRRAQR